MTDRVTTYVGAVPSASDTLKLGQFTMTSISKLAAAVLGTGNVVNGFTCTPTTPTATLNVVLGPGEIYMVENLEQSTWSALPSDNVHSILKQGVMLDSATIGITPPGTVGFSQVYLIEVQYQDLDTSLQVLNYYNAANPNSPFYGPPVGGSGTGQAQSTVRKGAVAYQAKAGTAATTGTQVAPTADAGWVGLFTVTVANGQTSITSGNIATLSSAPFIPVTLPAMPAWVQAGSYAWATDTGTANAIVTTVTPAISSYTAGLLVRVKKTSAANTGAMTINVNGVGAVALVDATGSALSSGAVPANVRIECVYDGSQFCILGGTSSVTNVSSLTANSGDMIQVTAGGVVNFRTALGTHSTTVNTGDKWPRGNQSDDTSRYMTTSEFVAWLNSTLSFVTTVPPNGPGVGVGQFFLQSATIGGALNPVSAGMALGMTVSGANLATGSIPGLNAYFAGTAGVNSSSVTGWWSIYSAPACAINGTVTGTWQLVGWTALSSGVNSGVTGTNYILIWQRVA